MAKKKGDMSEENSGRDEARKELVFKPRVWGMGLLALAFALRALGSVLEIAGRKASSFHILVLMVSLPLAVWLWLDLSQRRIRVSSSRLKLRTVSLNKTIYADLLRQIRIVSDRRMEVEYKGSYGLYRSDVSLRFFSASEVQRLKDAIRDYYPGVLANYAAVSEPPFRA